MHGTSTAEAIVEAASARARQLGRSSVKAVRVRIAAWSHLRSGELETAFEAASRGKPTQNAQLIIEVVEPSAKCQDCGADYSADSGTLRCPACGSARVAIDESREVEVEAIEI
jgi:hydrogenase nickel incorporation protein HypA/HybF